MAGRSDEGCARGPAQGAPWLLAAKAPTEPELCMEDDDDAAALRARVEAFADPFRDDWAAWRREEGPAGRLGQGWEDGLARARVLELPSRGEPSESPTASRPEAPRP